MEKLQGWELIKPIIITPNCIKNGRKQDCFNCGLFKIGKCDSPRSKCAKQYEGHKKGCPNYGKKSMCPPNIPMFDEVFDVEKDIYCIYYAYNIKKHMDNMKEKHPNWTDRQLRNVLYWQGTAKKEHKKIVNEFLKDHTEYEVIAPEAMGIDVTGSVKTIGIDLEWLPVNKSYRIAFAAIPKKGKSIKDYVDDKYNSLTCYY